MNAKWARLGWLVALAGLIAGGGWLAVRPGAGGRAAPPPANEDADPRPEIVGEPLPPAAHLRVVAARQPGAGAALLDPAAAGWEAARPTAVLLNRTPRIYRTEPVRERPVPALEVRAVRGGGALWLRLRWDDATRNAPQAPGRKKGEGGDPAVLYKRPTAHPAGFADAAAVMFPSRWQGPSFPSLQMGDGKNPVRLFYWNASRGGEEMTAEGRATPAPTGKTFAHRAAHAGGRWALAARLPELPDGYPVAFAVWDGEHQDRDGLKFFSIWYVLTSK
jgi:hypothetical protein